ncbi:hypothetical protein IWX46DRAFT_446909 [Phyllosticta citricarpa]|uniref:Secreted protein n=1 Tax=Phyllosticta citricarpa TaxID=55181 RepID=A0ABR1MKH7_9PEZI
MEGPRWPCRRLVGMWLLELGVDSLARLGSARRMDGCRFGPHHVGLGLGQAYRADAVGATFPGRWNPVTSSWQRRVLKAIFHGNSPLSGRARLCVFSSLYCPASLEGEDEHNKDQNFRRARGRQ